MYGNERVLASNLCRQFYGLGWVSGTGGGISIRLDDGNILIAPSGVQKEHIHPDDFFVINLEGEIVHPGPRGTKVSECAPLFLNAFKKRDAGAVIHSHSINSVLATRISGLSNKNIDTMWVEHALKHLPTKFETYGFEMVKGLRGKGFKDRVVVPIIENTNKECDLATSMAEAMDAFQDVDAVLVRSHGLYVWGTDWKQAKAQAECLDYLFDITVKLVQMGLDPRPG